MGADPTADGPGPPQEDRGTVRDDYDFAGAIRGALIPAKIPCPPIDRDEVLPAETRLVSVTPSDRKTPVVYRHRTEGDHERMVQALRKVLDGKV